MSNFLTKLKDGLKKTRNSWFDAIFGEDRISDEFFGTGTDKYKRAP